MTPMTGLVVISVAICLVIAVACYASGSAWPLFALSLIYALELRQS